MQIIQRKLLLGIAVAALAFSLPAADSRTLPVVNQKIAPGTLTGRIVFVDKSLHALAVEVKGKILQINVVSRVRVNKGGKLITFDELTAGQEVTITFRETPDGRLDVVSLSVEGSATQAEAAKAAAASSKAKGPPDPFPGKGNPANLGGPVHSPNH